MSLPHLTKRGLILGTGALGLAGLPVPSLALDPTPACEDGPTEAQTEGPFYRPRTPERADLREAGAIGEPVVVEGLVLTTDCRPLPGAVLDFWHADDRGDYDNAGYRYRGHQFADGEGTFRLVTIRPGRYPGRTPHIHVKVQGQATPLLTTQLYWPDEAERNARDGIFSDALLMGLSRGEDGLLHARFDFVLDGGGNA